MKKYYKKMNEPAPEGLLRLVESLQVFKDSKRLRKELYEESLSVIKQEGIIPGFLPCGVYLDYIKEDKFFSLNYMQILFSQGVYTFKLNLDKRIGEGIGSDYHRGRPVGEIEIFKIPGEGIREKFMEKDLLARIGKKPFSQARPFL